MVGATWIVTESPAFTFPVAKVQNDALDIRDSGKQIQAFFEKKYKVGS